MRTKIITLFLFIISIVSLLWVGIYNGLPLVYPDTGAYINSGFENKVPIDRPILYGLLIRHISLAESFWFVSLFQSIILAVSSYLFCKSFISSKNTLIISSISLIVLSFISTVSYFTSQLMPDFFTGILILNLLVFIFSESKFQIASLLLCVLSTGVHYSHLLLLTSVSIIALLINVKNSDLFMKLKKTIFINLACWLFVPLLHSCFGYGFHLSKASHIFLMGRLIESGVTKSFLNDKCETHNYSLCEYKNKLPKRAEAFWWESNSPIYTAGCMEGNGERCWLEKKQEYDQIIYESFSEWKYSKQFLSNCISNTKKQLITFSCSEIDPMMRSSVVLPQVLWHFKRESIYYQETKQSSSKLNFYYYNIINNYTLLFILFFLTSYFIYFRSKKQKILMLFILIILSLFINAAICSSLSCVADRFQARVIWLIPFLGVLIIVSHLNEYLKNVNKSNSTLP